MKNVFCRCIICILCLSLIIPSAFAIGEEIPDDFVVLEIEAEDMELNNAFDVVADPFASNSKCIRDKGNGETATYIFSSDKSISNLQIYIESKAANKNSCLSYFSIDHFESYGIYSKLTDKWTLTRLYFGDAIPGRHKINITSLREGNMIDKIVIMYKPVESKLNNEINYMPGNKELEGVNLPVVEERQPGSFYFEMENAKLEDGMVVEKDSYASGGAYVVADTTKNLPMIVDPMSTDIIHARFKFYISKKGTYTLYNRFIVPDINQKSSFVAIDNTQYENFGRTLVNTDWMWQKNSIQRHLDIGWHTLDIKYRQTGHKLDSFILTNVPGFMPNGVGSLPGEDIVVDDPTQEVIDKLNSDSKLKVNNYRYHVDAEFEIINNEVYAPATNVISTLGIRFEIYDGYYIARRDRNYIKFYANSDEVIINGKRQKISAKIKVIDNAVPLIPISLLKKAFDIDYEYEAMRNTLHIFDMYEIKYDRLAKDGEIQIETDISNAYFTIPHDNPNVRVEVYAKLHTDDERKATLQNHDGLFKLTDGGYTKNWFQAYRGMRGSTHWEVWAKATDVHYRDGAFRASIGQIERYPYDVLVKITDENYKQEVIFKEYAFQGKTPPLSLPLMTAEEYAYKTNGELLLVPTINNMSYYIDQNKDIITTCEVTFSEVGTNEIKKAYEPFWDESIGQYRGSIVNLKENTEYEVRAVISDENGKVISEKTARMKTWPDNPTIGKTIKATEIYNGGTLALGEIKGTPEKWIKIDGEGMTIDVGANEDYSVYISGCEYIIFENFKIRGGFEAGILICGDSHDVRIVNCDISNWGYPGVLKPEYGMYMIYGNPLGAPCAIYPLDVSNIVIERCYMHDPAARTNTWSGEGWVNKHPYGPGGIYLQGVRGLVIRYNDIIGTDDHRMHDCLIGANNGYRKYSSTGSDSDIYGNMLLYAEDDIMELDGGQMNVRVYDNHMEQALCGISVAPNMMGPTYVYRNVITNLGTSQNEMTGRAIKTGNSPDAINGVTYFFHNTLDSETHILDNCNFSGPDYHSVTRNNIFNSRNGTHALTNTTLNHLDDNDYDMLHGEVLVKEGDETNKVDGQPTYVNQDIGLLGLTKDSLGIDSGIYLDNFSDGYMVGNAPDMGAYEYGGNISFYPVRPIEISADKYKVIIEDGKSAELEIYIGDIENGLKYNILKSPDLEWLEIISEVPLENVDVLKNTTIKLTLRADLSKCHFEDGNGAIVFRLSNGYSLPIVVYAK